MFKVAVAGDVGSGRDVAARARAARELLSEHGYQPVAVSEAEGLMWAALFDPDGLSKTLSESPGIRWVQLPRTGIDNFLDVIRTNPQITFTCAKGAFAPEVAEHALMLTLAVMRRAVEQARSLTWHVVEAQSLQSKRVTIVGGGFVAERLLELLAPFDCEVTIVRRTRVEVPGAARTVGQDQLEAMLETTDVLFLALSLTRETTGLIGAGELAKMPAGSYVINVARGQHVDDAALAAAVESGHIAGAGLDVTDPEPLPDSNPLWKLDNVLVTSHSANSVEYMVRRLAERCLDNVRLLDEGRDAELIGVVDPEAGY